MFQAKYGALRDRIDTTDGFTVYVWSHAPLHTSTEVHAIWDTEPPVDDADLVTYGSYAELLEAVERHA